jgi:hypothetical protein
MKCALAGSAGLVATALVGSVSGIRLTFALV